MDELLSKMKEKKLPFFGPTVYGTIRFADPENPILEPNMTWIG